MDVKVSDLAAKMLAAVRESLGNDFAKVKDFASPELETLAQSLVNIGRLAAEGKATPRQAKALLKVHLNTTQTIFLTVEGLGIIAVENAINAALGAVRDTINGSLGFTLV